MKKILVIISITILLIVIILYFLNKKNNHNENVLINNEILSNNNLIFELIYEGNNNSEINNIIIKGELLNYNHNIYSVGGNIKVKINDNIYNLRNALLNKTIDINEIINKCIKDENENKVNTDMYEDGGTKQYQYENYWIIICNTLEGNKDIYITAPNVTYNSLNI